MDSRLPPRPRRTSDAPPPEEDQQHPPQLPPSATASISLSLSSLLSSSTDLLFPSFSKLSPPPSLSTFSNVKIPSQISTVSLTSSPSTLPSNSSHHSSSSSFLLHAPLRRLSRRSSDPSNPAAVRRCTVVWFRNDLRVHDNEALTTASNESVSVLPVYIFDPRDHGKSSSGFDKTGPYRATFLLESVADLRKNLRERGSDLVVRNGRPETVLVDMAKAVGADALFTHREVSLDEVRAEEKVEKAMEEGGVEVKYFWGSTLYHIDDLPFEVEQMPSNYGGFRDRMQGLAVRKTIEGLDQIKGLPSRGNVEVGEIPNLCDLGLNPAPSMDGKPTVHVSLTGGESEALDILKKFVAEFRAQPHEDNNMDSIYGANFSCKISPWLAMGCLSPRFMFDELKKSTSRTIVAPTQKKGGIPGDNGMNWFMFELLWRDFFRFITKKYNTGKRKREPVPSCLGAVA